MKVTRFPDENLISNDNFDTSNKPEEGSQTAKILTQVRAKVKEIYQNRDIYHKEKLNTFLPE